VLRQEPRGWRSKFYRNTSMELTSYDLGNNGNHYDLRMVNPKKAAVACTLQNHVDGQFDGELINPNQIMDEEMAISSECDDDDEGNEDLQLLDFESEFFSYLILGMFICFSTKFQKIWPWF